MRRPGFADVALFGTFDVANYGDLLFPHVAAHLLGDALGQLRCYSPRGTAPDWADTVPVRAVGTFDHDPPPALCLIGGGNIVHANPTPLPDYAGAFADPHFTYASLWLGASVLAARHGARLAWNAPGVPSPIEGAWARGLRDLALAATDYVCVRDEASRALLGGTAAVPVVLPDTALALDAVWPAETLAELARQAFRDRGMAVPERWVVFHLNDRYLSPDLQGACAVASRIAADLQAVPVLLAIGPCHGDDDLAGRAHALFEEPALLVDRPKGLKEIAALIAHGQAYAGSSMHGLITALAYRRPGLAVARPRMVKFLGLLEPLGEAGRLQEGWPAAARAAPDLLRPLSVPTLDRLAEAGARIRLHGGRLRRLLTQPSRRSVADGRAILHAAVSAEVPAFPEWGRLARALSPVGPEAGHPASDPTLEAAAIAEILAVNVGPQVGRRIAVARRCWPHDLRLALLEAEWLERSGDPASARVRLTHLQALHPGNPWPSVRLVRLLVSIGEGRVARSLYDERLRDARLPASVRQDLSARLVPPV